MLANKIADELVENKQVEMEIESRYGVLPSAAGYRNFDDVEDDGTMHKFMNITFNETVTCQSCNKKVRVIEMVHSLCLFHYIFNYNIKIF